MPTDTKSNYRQRRPLNESLIEDTRDYWVTHRDQELPFDDPQGQYAVYLPATSSNYVSYNSRNRISEFGLKTNGYQPGQRIPSGFREQGDELNYYQKDCGGFYYGAGLYSSGHATLDPIKTLDREFFVHERDPDVTLIGDSGGFQWATGTWKTDWTDLNGIDKVRATVLKWLELTADYSMVLDFPANGIVLNPDFDSFYNMVLKTHPTVDKFNACLEFTLENIDYFLKHRTPGATKFLNVVQGANPEQADYWYDRVKDLPLEGWALAGNITLDYSSSLQLLIKMRDEQKINKDQAWIHLLGLSRVSNAPILTKIQRILRQQIDPSVTISFDSSSPFLSASKALIYAQTKMTAKRFSTSAVAGPDDKKFVGSSTLLGDWLKEEHGVKDKDLSGISTKLTLGDFCVKGFDIDSNSSWDTITYMFLMNHNTEIMIRGIQEANKICDGTYKHGLEWHEEGGECPLELFQMLNQIIPEIFESENPMDKIELYKKQLKEFNTPRFVTDTVNYDNPSLEGLKEFMPPEKIKIKKPKEKPKARHNLFDF